jgi:hypothetical protein
LERRESSRRRRALEAGEIDGIFEQCEDEGVDTRVKVEVGRNSFGVVDKVFCMSHIDADSFPL